MAADKKQEKSAAPGFRFSPRPNRAGRINWQPWSEEAFSRSRQEHKPVLLAISAVWCHWCHVMDEITYSDEEAIALINDGFIPVRVDSDQRPDVNARYNQGGWPTIALLTGDGEVIAGTTYIPPEELRRLLGDIRSLYLNHNAELRAAVETVREQRRELAGQHPETANMTAAVSAYLLEVVGDVYDSEFGGFGSNTKFPYTNVLSLILTILAEGSISELEDMLDRTLDAMAAGGMNDQAGGGFFRYSTDREWRAPHYEKLLEDNAGLMAVYAEAAHILQNGKYEGVARNVYRYLVTVLLDPATGAFRGSQDADERYYGLDAAAREMAAAPYVDPTVFSGGNALTASSLYRCFQIFGDLEMRDRATAALDFVWRHLWDAEAGLYHYYHDGEARLPGLLGDNARLISACLDAYESGAGDAWIDRALKAAGWLLNNLEAEEPGGFYDCVEPPGGEGPAAERSRPLVENSIAASALVRLAQNSGQPRFGEAAERALAYFSTSYKDSGLFAADYAIAVERLLDPPVRVSITGPPGEPATIGMIRAAHLARIPFRSVEVLDPAVHNEELDAAGYGYAGRPVAYICIGASCQPAVTDPKDLPGRLEAGRVR